MAPVSTPSRRRGVRPPVLPRLPCLDHSRPRGVLPRMADGDGTRGRGVRGRPWQTWVTWQTASAWDERDETWTASASGTRAPPVSTASRRRVVRLPVLLCLPSLDHSRPRGVALTYPPPPPHVHARQAPQGHARLDAAAPFSPACAPSVVLSRGKESWGPGRLVPLLRSPLGPREGPPPTRRVSKGATRKGVTPFDVGLHRAAHPASSRAFRRRHCLGAPPTLF